MHQQRLQLHAIHDSSCTIHNPLIESSRFCLPAAALLPADAEVVGIGPEIEDMNVEAFTQGGPMKFPAERKQRRSNRIKPWYMVHQATDESAKQLLNRFTLASTARQL